MATYVIGDIQGCFDELLQLLKLIEFNPRQDYLWFCGDLVNRGPKSLEVLRFVRDLGDRAITVLGNHDLHLLALYYQKKPIKESNSLYPILQADDLKPLMKWLRKRPVAHYDKKFNTLLVHAGLAPQWDLQTTLGCAAEVNQILTNKGFKRFFDNMYGDKPNIWSDNLTGWERLRFVVNTFTRLRFCDSQGHLDMKYKGAPGSQPQELIPWFDHPERACCDVTILFGHWSTLGLHQSNNTIALDSGCLWGGSLSALRLEDHALFSLPCTSQCEISSK